MSAYIPSDEDASMLGQDRANFVGAVLEGWLYGILCVLAGLCAYYLKADMLNRRTHSTVMLALVFALFTCGTLALAGNTVMAQHMFVDYRAFPGGPSAWLNAYYSMPANVMNDAVFFVGGFIADGLLVYRTWMVYNNNYYVVAVPAIMWIGAFVVSCFDIYQIARPGATLSDPLPAVLTIAYIASTVSVNIVLTALIAVRLLWMRSRVMKNLGPQHGKTYTSIVSMIVESALLYTSTALTFLVSFILNSPVALAMCPIVSQTVFISPMLIIWRVAVGRAWSPTVVQKANSPHTSIGGSRVSNLEQLRFRDNRTGQYSDVTAADSTMHVSITQEKHQLA